MFDPSKFADLLFPPNKVEVKPYTRDIDGLIAWLETQPHDRAYDWYNICGCLVRAFLVEGCGAAMRPSGSAEASYDGVFPSVEVYHEIGRKGEWTMGKALSRALSYRNERGSI